MHTFGNKYEENQIKKKKIKVIVNEKDVKKLEY